MTCLHRIETSRALLQEMFIPQTTPTVIFSDALSVVFLTNGNITKSQWMLGRLAAVIAAVDEGEVIFVKISGKANPVNSLTKYVPLGEFERDIGFLTNEPRLMEGKYLNAALTRSPDKLEGVRSSIMKMVLESIDLDD